MAASAHTTCLFQSSDPVQPEVFHGITCAHDMNIVSTASLFPHMPSNVNGFLSFIVVGPCKFNFNQLGTVFRMRKPRSGRRCCVSHIHISSCTGSSRQPHLYSTWDLVCTCCGACLSECRQQTRQINRPWIAEIMIIPGYCYVP